MSTPPPNTPAPGAPALGTPPSSASPLGATPSDPPGPTGPTGPRRRARRPLLIVSLVFLAAALLISALLGGSGAEPASASWSPAPEVQDPGSPVPQACAGTGTRTAIEEVLVAERRGITLMVVGLDSAGDTFTCLAIGEDGPSTTVLTSGPGEERAQIPADGLVPEGMLLSQIDPAAQDDDDTAQQLAVSGAAGADVVAVTLRTSVGDVEASVDNGAFSAWWPTADTSELDIPITAVVTCADGTSRTLTLSADDIPADSTDDV